MTTQITVPNFALVAHFTYLPGSDVMRNAVICSKRTNVMFSEEYTVLIEVPRKVKSCSANKHHPDSQTNRGNLEQTNTDTMNALLETVLCCQDLKTNNSVVPKISSKIWQCHSEVTHGPATLILLHITEIKVVCCTSLGCTVEARL